MITQEILVGDQKLRIIRVRILVTYARSVDNQGDDDDENEDI